jgi:endonuclease III
MNATSQQATVRALLDQYGQTFAEEAGIELEEGTPEGLFQLLCLAVLLSAPTSSEKAMGAIQGLIEADLATPEKMAEASKEQRVEVLDSSGYDQLDERAATRLGDTAELVLRVYYGNLDELREAAKQDVERERELLLEFKGIGPLGADIFLREVQGVWEEVYPYADERVLEAAGKLGLGKDAESLSQLVDREEFVRLVAALVRVELDDGYEQLRKV